VRIGKKPAFVEESAASARAERRAVPFMRWLLAKISGLELFSAYRLLLPKYPALHEPGNEHRDGAPDQHQGQGTEEQTSAGPMFEEFLGDWIPGEAADGVNADRR